MPSPSSKSVRAQFKSAAFSSVKATGTSKYALARSMASPIPRTPSANVSASAGSICENAWIHKFMALFHASELERSCSRPSCKTSKKFSNCPSGR